MTSIQQAIHELDAGPYQTAIYDSMEILVESGWDNATDVYDVEAVLSDQSVPAWALAAAKGNAKQLAFMVVDRERKALQALLEQAIADGLTAKDFAADIREFFDSGYHVLAPDGVHGFDGTDIVRTTPTKAWSTMVARTELSRAQSMGAMALYETAGIAKVQWIAADGPNTCPECADADETIVALGEAFPFVDVEHPPAHPCAPAGTKVVLARGVVPIETVVVGDQALTHTRSFRTVREVMSREVCEQLVELRVAGRRLTVTGNHPIRTPNGWTAAEALQPGDEVCCVGSEAVIGSTLESQYVPSGTGQEDRLANVLSSLPFGVVPVPAIDFDRDQLIGKCNIDSVDVNSKVRHGVESGVDKRREDERLKGAVGLIGPALSAADAGSVGTGTATHGVVSSGRDAPPLFETSLRHSQALSGTTSPPRQAEASKPVRDHASAMGTPELDRESENGFASHVSLMESTNLVVGQQALHWFILRIDSVTRVAHRGLVYNFAVEHDESYVAEGIVVHNCCQCGLVPADEDLGNFSGTQEQRDRAARGGYSAEDYEKKFGAKHPIDKEAA